MVVDTLGCILDEISYRKEVFNVIFIRLKLKAFFVDFKALWQHEHCRSLLAAQIFLPHVLFYIYRMPQFDVAAWISFFYYLAPFWLCRPGLTKPFTIFFPLH